MGYIGRYCSGQLVLATVLAGSQVASAQYQNMTASDADQTLVGLSATEEFGYDAALGNLLGGPDEELAIGAPGASNDRGRVDFFRYGVGSGLFDSIPMSILGPDIPGDPLDDDLRFGQVLAIGDINGDGKKELIVGAPGKSAGTSGPGKVYIYEESSGPAIEFTLVAEIVGVQAGENFGWSVAVADLNGDGVKDLIIGARYWSHDEIGEECVIEDTCCKLGEDWVGRVYIFYGWLGTVIPPTLNAEDDADIVICGMTGPDSYRHYFGDDVQYLGDLRGDGNQYFAATAYRATDALVGQTCVEAVPQFCNDCRIGVVSVFSMDTLNWHIAQNGGNKFLEMGDVRDLLLSGDQSFDRYGKDIIEGDFNGDGVSDLLVGATQSIKNIPYHAYGYARVEDLVTGEPIFSINGSNLSGASVGDRFGWWVDKLPGLEGLDSRDELVVSAPLWPASGSGLENQRGRVYVFTNDGVNTSLLFHISGALNKDRIGTAFWSHHDFNLQGTNDIVVGAPAAMDTVSGQRRGAVYFFYLD